MDIDLLLEAAQVVGLSSLSAQYDHCPSAYALCPQLPLILISSRAQSSQSVAPGAMSPPGSVEPSC